VGPRESCVNFGAQGYGYGIMVGRARYRGEARWEQVFDNSELVTIILVGWPELFVLRLLDKNWVIFF